MPTWEVVLLHLGTSAQCNLIIKMPLACDLRQMLKKGFQSLWKHSPL